MTESLNNSNLSSTADISETKNRTFPKAIRKKGFPNDEVLIARYSCALQKDILLLQGFFYVSENYFCYYSNVVGFINQVVIPLSKVKSIIKKNAALVVPNAIQIDTKTGESYFFLSFINRDSVYTQLMNLWEDYKKNHRASLLIKKHMRESNDSRHIRSGTKMSKASTSKSNTIELGEKKSNTLTMDIKKQNTARFNEDLTNEHEDEGKTSKPKFQRTYSTPNLSPSTSPKFTVLTRTNTINYKDRKSNTYSRRNLHHHSSSSKNHLKKENSYLDLDSNDDEENVQNDIIFPEYIPKVNTMKEYRFIKIFLFMTMIVVGFVIVLSCILRIKIYTVSKELNTIKNDTPFFDPSTFDFSSIVSNEDQSGRKKSRKNRKEKDISPENKEMLSKLQQLSDLTGLTIPQLLNINWDDYELIN